LIEGFIFERSLKVFNMPVQDSRHRDPVGPNPVQLRRARSAPSL
jgi:hypothetical protein